MDSDWNKPSENAPSMGRRAASASIAAALCSIAGLARSGDAHAQSWPSKPVRMIVPYGAGNQADQVARVLADSLSKSWGQPVVVENVAGAGGAIGVGQIARAAPDGYTIGIAAIAALAITPHMQKAPYDPLVDLMPLAGASVASGSVFVVHAGLGVTRLDELVRLARSRVDKPLLYYSPGNGTIPHLNMEILRKALDFPATHVPYRTAAAGTTDLMSGEVDMALDNLSVQRAAIDSGKVRAIFTPNPQRLAALPGVPTLAELNAGVELPSAWQSIHGPKGLPSAIADRIARDVLEIVSSADYARRMPPGTEALPLDREAVAKRIRNEHRRFGVVVNELGLRS
jgi:tripartite-type tricarboxylate transporter receptor subunit TctC